MRTFRDYDVDDIKVEERRSLLPKNMRRIRALGMNKDSPTWPGLTVATVLFVWWTWFVVSDWVGYGEPTFNVDGLKFYDFDEV